MLYGILWKDDSHLATREITPTYFIELQGPLPHSQKSTTRLLWASSIRCTFSHTVSRVSVLKLHSHLRLGLPSGLFPRDFPTKIMYAFLISFMRVTCPAHLIHLYLITLVIFCEEFKLWSPSLCTFMQSPTTSSLLGPNILLSTLKLRSSLKVRDQISRPYKTTGRVVVSTS
jgi:hypothetical protein